MKVSGYLIDIHNRDIYPAVVNILNGKIHYIERHSSAPQVYIIPGLIDAHIHIESSMVTPGAFALAAVRHGTTAVVSDPHEIANVLGIAGVRYMINDGKKVPLKFCFGAPSCVPATEFESSGAVLSSKEIGELLCDPDIGYLSEVMNFPGVIYGDEEVNRKISLAKRLNKPIDGHAPGIRGEMLRKYVNAGITTDHECSTIEEALEKIELGMNILIREGSAARNLEALKDLYSRYPDRIMLCSDDLHPEMLEKRHINKLVSRLIEDGYDIYDVLRSATIIPALHYSLDQGLLRTGDSADFVIVDSLNKMNVIETWIDGVKVFGAGKVLFSYAPGDPLNKFVCSAVTSADIAVSNVKKRMRILEAFDGELTTREIIAETGSGRFIESDKDADILKIVVKDRYKDAAPAIGFVKGFGLKRGAFASSVAHDSHNIIAVGADDNDLVSAINEIVRMKGGLAVSEGGVVSSLQLNIAGIMTTSSCREVASDYEHLTAEVKSLGCTMAAPFMTLSFMALLVIPELKIGDRGLFDVNKFQPVSLFLE